MTSLEVGATKHKNAWLIDTVQLKGNLIHVGNMHAFFMRVARTRECVYGCTRMAHGYTRMAKDNCDR